MARKKSQGKSDRRGRRISRLGPHALRLSSLEQIVVWRQGKMMKIAEVRNRPLTPQKSRLPSLTLLMRVKMASLMAKKYFNKEKRSNHSRIEARLRSRAGSKDKVTMRLQMMMSIARSSGCSQWSGKLTSPKMIRIRICKRIQLALSNSLKTRYRWRLESNFLSSWPSLMKAVACSARMKWSWQMCNSKTNYRILKGSSWIK